MQAAGHDAAAGPRSRARSLVRWAGLILSGSALLTFAFAAAASAAPSITIVPDSLAGYYTPQGSTGASTGLIVPAINCEDVPAGTFAGQSYGIYVWDNQNSQAGFAEPPTYNSSVDVRAYCDGTQPVYNTEFVIPQTPGTTFFSPANVAVRPGDTVVMWVSVSSTSTRLYIKDLCTGKDASVTGPLGSLDAGPNIGMSGVTPNGSGGVLDSGSEGDTTPGLPGPVTAKPAVFQGATISGKPILRAPGLVGETWSSATATLAEPTMIAADNFAVVVTNPAP